MKRPNAMIYMALWGGVTGWLSAALTLLILNIVEIAGQDVWTSSALFGGISGMFLGFIAGVLIRYLLDNSRRLLFEEAKADAENMVSSLSLFGMMVMLLSFRIPFGISLLYVCIIPLSLWLGTARYYSNIKPFFAEIQAGIKAKNAARLADKNKIQADTGAQDEAKKKSLR